MVNTVSIKEQQLKNGYFQTGSGEEKIFILGSCRVAPIVNYFEQLNADKNRFTIYSVDPYNFCYNLKDERVDMEAKILSLETDQSFLAMIASVDVFIYEWYQNFGMFNVGKDNPKNIFQFGMNPKTQICIPPFNDHFILFGDIIKWDSEIRKKANADVNVLGKISKQTTDEMYVMAVSAYNKFYEVCRKSDIPEMEQYFKENHYRLRMHHNFNHVTKHFTLAIFDFVCQRLGIVLSDEFWNQISGYDMFDSNFTALTEDDVEYFGYYWEEHLKPLKSFL